MIISKGMPAISSVVVNQGTLVSANASALTDGRPGTSTIFRTPASTGSTLRFTLTFAAPYFTSIVPYHFARVDNLRTVAPVPFVAMTLLGPSLAAFSSGAVFDNGIGYPSRTALLARSAFGPGYADVTGIQIDIHNDGSSSLVSVGEIFLAHAAEIGVERYNQTLVDPSTTRRSSGNQPWPLFRIPFRKGKADFSNMSYSSAFIYGEDGLTGIGNLQEMLYAASTAGAIGCIPFWRADKKAALDQNMIDKNSFLARVTDIGGIDGIATKRRWAASIGVEELL